MPDPVISDTGSFTKAFTKIEKFMTNHELLPGTGISLPPYHNVKGYRHINIFVEFTQEDATEAAVDLGVVFAFDANGTMGASSYVNLEENVSGTQTTNFINISPSHHWHGSPSNKSSYVARFPVMGPFVQVFLYNQAPVKRKISVWGFLVS